jgi:putative flavoprotein involved in K+ transport
MVIIIGGGPAGLAAAAALKAEGVPAQVLDRAAEVGASWKAHYDRLHLHTVRWLSGLPGLPIPRRYGPWVARDDLVQYLKDYATHHGLDVRLGVEVTRLDPGWKLLTSAGEMTADRVVIATGYNRVPWMPPWPGQFSGELLHASRYKNGAPFAGRHVLVVGSGNTGAEIAVDLVEQGARKVELSVRTPPTVLRRAVGGLPTQALGVLLRRWPPSLVDAISSGLNRLLVGDLSRYGLARPARGAFTRVLEDGQIPILDVGLVDALKTGKVTVVGAVEGFDAAEVMLAGGRTAPEVVIAATGYRRGLEELVGHLGVLDERGLPTVHGPATHEQAPGLHFTGYTNPISGNLRELAIDARKIARAVRRASRERAA